MSLNNEAVEFLDKGDYEAAGTKLQKAISLKEVDGNVKADISRNLAVYFGALNERDSSLFHARRAIEFAEEDSYTFWISRAEFAMLKSNVNEARAWFEKAKEMDSTQIAPYNNLGIIYSGKYGRKFENEALALQNNKKAFELEKREPLGVSLAFTYMNANRYSEALPIWKELQKLAPGNMEYVFHEGVCLYFSGKEDDGTSLMEKAADRDDKCREMLEEMY